MRCYAGGNQSKRESKRKESSLLVAVVGQVRCQRKGQASLR